MLKKISLALAALLTGVMLALPATASAALIDGGVKSQACAGISATEDGKCDKDAESTVTKTIRLAINILSWIVGIISIIMIIISGLRYVTSSGDSNTVNSAKNALIYAVIGLVIVALAQFIVQFVLDKTSATTTTTSIPQSIEAS